LNLPLYATTLEEEMQSLAFMFCILRGSVATKDRAKPVPIQQEAGDN
jgi:hypothetical protein